MKYKKILFWTIIYCALFIFLECEYRFHFYFYEQKYLFLFSSDYAFEQLSKLGGLVDYLSAFLAQFYIYPYIGSAITSALLVGTGILTEQVVKTISPYTKSYFVCLLPLILLLFIHFDFNYFIQGTIAYMIVLAAVWGYIQINSLEKRLILGICFIPFLYSTIGPATLLFTLSIVIWECLHKQRYHFYALFLLIEAIGISFLAVYFSYIGEFRLAFLPDAYYHFKLRPTSVIYFSWIVLPCIIIFSFWSRDKKLEKKASYIWYSLQGILIGCILYWGLPKYSDKKSGKLKELDYYARMEEWDKITEACKGKMTNYLYMNYLNLALANQGVLADQLFAYDQRGPLALIVNWNKTTHISTLLSDIHFAMGNIALSQEMAFEGNIGIENGRLLKRLVQTNLIYGAYPIAEKYISVLEKTLYYRKWAVKQREYLYNDKALATDSLLNAKRKCLPSINSLAQINGLDIDLERIAEANPAHITSIQYVGCLYLMGKDLDTFKAFIEKYYGTKVLPLLPISFQEAVIAYSEADSSYWEEYGVSKMTKQRYRTYKQLLLSNKKHSNLQNIMYQSFGNTYWYYLMFK